MEDILTSLDERHVLISIAQLLHYQTLLGSKLISNYGKMIIYSVLHRRNTVIEAVLHVRTAVVEAVLGGGEALVDIVADIGQLLQDCSTLINGW